MNCLALSHLITLFLIIRDGSFPCVSAEQINHLGVVVD